MGIRSMSREVQPLILVLQYRISDSPLWDRVGTHCKVSSLLKLQLEATSILKELPAGKQNSMVWIFHPAFQFSQLLQIVFALFAINLKGRSIWDLLLLLIMVGYLKAIGMINPSCLLVPR